MVRRHIVRQGESLISLSKQYGLTPEKIANHPDNRQVMQRKRRTSVLHPGDRITIPDLETKEVEAATEEKHRFRCGVRMTWLKLKLFQNDRPRSNEPYRLIFNLNSVVGQLDDQGRLEQRIPADIQQVKLLLGENEEEELILNIGNMDPIANIGGIQKRLVNLGFSCGNEEGWIGPRTHSAIRAFQTKHDLEPTGELDDATRARMEEIHGY